MVVIQEPSDSIAGAFARMVDDPSPVSHAIGFLPPSRQSSLQLSVLSARQRAGLQWPPRSPASLLMIRATSAGGRSSPAGGRLCSVLQSLKRANCCSASRADTRTPRYHRVSLRDESPTSILPVGCGWSRALSASRSDYRDTKRFPCAYISATAVRFSPCAVRGTGAPEPGRPCVIGQRAVTWPVCAFIITRTLVPFFLAVAVTLLPW